MLLHTTSTGSGKPIILLHGYLSSSHYFTPLVRRLGTTHRVITIDLLGFGASPKPKGHYGYEQHIAALHETIESLDIAEPFALLGHSMGSLIALRYASQYGDRVRTLLLFNTPLFTNKTQMIESHKATGKHYQILLFSPIRHTLWSALRLVPHTSLRHRAPINYTDAVRIPRHAREGSYKNIIGDARLFTDIRKVAMPVLLIVGRYDRVVYQQNLQGKQLPSNVELRVVETGHHTIVKNTDIAEDLIRNFI